MQINTNATTVNDDLDARIEAATQQQWRIRDEAARLHEDRLIGALRAAFPGGGTAVSEMWTDDDDTDVALVTVLDPAGVIYLAPGGDDASFDRDVVLGVDAYEAIMADLRGIVYAKAARWSYGRAIFAF